MSDQFKNIQQVISNYIKISDEEWPYYSSMLQVKVLQKKTMLLFERTIFKEVFFVNSGSLKIYFVDNKGQ
jgi:CRP-like cAMP-binding protein